MDNHPIPQDVTGFQFKLIGSMTVKQFAYVAFGVILAVILYYLPLKAPFGILFKMVFIPLFGGSGFVIAFLPIEGRPVDIMLGNFIKSIFMPNQYLYHKVNTPFAYIKHVSAASSVGKQKPLVTPQQEKEKRLRAALQSAHAQQANPLDQREQAFLQSLTVPQPLQAAQVQPLSPQPQMVQPMAPKNTPDALKQQEQVLLQALEQTKKEGLMQKTPAAQSSAQQKMLLLERQIQTIHAQRLQLEQQSATLQRQAITNQPAPRPQVSAHNIPQNMTQKAGLPHIPDVPNVIVGIVKDPRGNVLPNMLVEVKDKEGNPVRAFKTNLLGQFASATPLALGMYTIELEDPKKLHSFDVIQINASNQILQPIEVTSHDAREALRKELFN